jgi:cytidylate kinase
MSIVAISRAAFCGGEALANAVAGRLGYECVSREMILEETAKEHGLPVEDLTVEMERRPSLWNWVLGERTTHLACVRATLCTRAQRGRLVYHGYLGHLLLPGISHVIAVRVIADMGFRVETASQQQNLAERDALACIEKVDEERQRWTRFLFGVDWDAPHLYDVVLNLSRMSLETACESLARLTERDEFKPTAESVKALQSLALISRVWAALGMDPRIRGAELNVEAKDGIVTVTGSARSAGVEEVVRMLIRQIDGVKWVRVHIDSLDETLSLYT